MGDILKQLCAGQLPQERPESVTIVFQEKLQDMKDQILKKEIFRHIETLVFNVEFKKGALPHMHLIVILN